MNSCEEDSRLYTDFVGSIFVGNTRISRIRSSDAFEWLQLHVHQESANSWSRERSTLGLIHKTTVASNSAPAERQNTGIDLRPLVD
jgi:hypothetical protein